MASTPLLSVGVVHATPPMTSPSCGGVLRGWPGCRYGEDGVRLTDWMHPKQGPSFSTFVRKRKITWGGRDDYVALRRALPADVLTVS